MVACVIRTCDAIASWNRCVDLRAYLNRAAYLNGRQPNLSAISSYPSESNLGPKFQVAEPGPVLDNTAHGTSSETILQKNWSTPVAWEAKVKNVRRLRIEPISGTPINDYRLRLGRVEFRALDADGRHLRGDLSRWRRLTDDEVQWHLLLGTVVAQWMDLAAKS